VADQLSRFKHLEYTTLPHDLQPRTFRQYCVHDSTAVTSLLWSN